jgi:hypothetical protein
MPHPAADRNLLFGILALQMDFVSRDALIAAMNAWVLDKGKALGQIFDLESCKPPLPAAKGVETCTLAEAVHPRARRQP